MKAIAKSHRTTKVMALSPIFLQFLLKEAHNLSFKLSSKIKASITVQSKKI